MPNKITDDQREKWGDVSPARAAELDKIESDADTRYFYSRQGGGTFAVNWAELNADQRELFMDRTRRGELLIASGEDDVPDAPEAMIEGRVARIPSMQAAGEPMAPRQGVDPRHAGVEGGQALSDAANAEIKAEFDAVKDLAPDTPGDVVAQVKQDAGVEARAGQNAAGLRETARGRSAAKKTATSSQS